MERKTIAAVGAAGLLAGVCGYYIGRRTHAGPSRSAVRCARATHAKYAGNDTSLQGKLGGDDTPILPGLTFDHIAIEASDVDASIQFYKDLLGFYHIKRPPFSSKGAWLALAGGVRLHIAGCPNQQRLQVRHQEARRREIRGWESLPLSGDHLALVTQDLDALQAQLKDAGIAYKLSEPNAAGSQQVFFFDPDGNAIEVGTPVAKEFQYSFP